MSHSDGVVRPPKSSAQLSPGVQPLETLSVLVRLHGAAVRLFGHHESHQLPLELLDLLHVLGLVRLVL